MISSARSEIEVQNRKPGPRLRTARPLIADAMMQFHRLDMFSPEIIKTLSQRTAMKKFLIIASAAMFAVGSFSHGAEDHAASAAKAAADGHAHSQGHGDADAVGVAGDAAKVTRIVAVDMTDAMRFTPAGISARQGETIRFTVKNAGQVKHEFVLGTEKE